jgi:hypothetical protein
MYIFGDTPLRSSIVHSNDAQQNEDLHDFQPVGSQAAVCYVSPFSAWSGHAESATK